MFNLFKKLNDTSSAALKTARPQLVKINALEETMRALSDDELRARTAQFKERFSAGEKLDEILPEAYATVREAGRRVRNERHFDSQILGGIILHRRGIAEMRTGEGKTLVATLPVYLNALAGQGVHVVTVNDYLARRDATWMGEVYSFLGLSVAVISQNQSYIYDRSHVSSTEGDTQEENEIAMFKVEYEYLKPCTRREAYEADITYGTNSEFGFDYLRDNLEFDKDSLRQRGHYYAVVDEVDSILIDEARTPLIISAPAGDSTDLYVTFSHIADKLLKDEDYVVDEKLKAISLTDAGIEKAEKLLGIENMYTEGGVKYVHHLETAVRAKALFNKDKEYVVKDNEVIIVDEFTGHLQPGRRWSEGLHQAIEAKENATIQQESRTFASITYQNYFRLYEKLSGMTGTAETSSEEFYKVYGLDTVVIPTNRPNARDDKNDLIFQTEKGKFMAIARIVKEVHEKGQPILIGTASIEKNELLSAYLKKEGVPHEILNAKNHEREGEIIAQAGRKGAVTIATNMAGRGVDIKLGGVPMTPESYEEIKNLGGLFVLGTERHEARRIDNQLRGRAGRQGDPGTTQFFVSMEDTLMRVFAPDTMKNMMGKLGIPEDEPIQNSMITRSLETAQTRIEGFHFDARKHVLEYDNVLNHQRASIYTRRGRILTGEAEDIEMLLDEVLVPDEALQEIIQQKKQEIGPEEFTRAVRRILLQVLDMLWVDHLEAMDYLRNSVNLRAYGQRDPLVEYKKEGLMLYHEMEENYANEVARLLPHIAVGVFARVDDEQVKAVEQGITNILDGAKDSGSGQQHATREGGEKIGRNDACHCGSGKKYKHCHGK